MRRRRLGWSTAGEFHLSGEEDLPFGCICHRKVSGLYSRLDLLLCEAHFTEDEE